MHYVLVLLTIALACHRAYAGQPITFKCNKLITRSLKNIANVEKFSGWFEDPKTPTAILNANPGIDEIEELDDGKVRGYLAPLKFPGLTVTTIIDFDTEFDGKCFVARCRPDSVQQDYDGNKFFARIVSKLLPSVDSRTAISYDEERAVLANEADLTISFELPDWFPIPADKIESNGSNTINGSIEVDINALLDKLIEVFSESLVVDVEFGAAIGSNEPIND